MLQAFEAAASGVLVGTQMVAKGHDFPGVSLGVVLDADQTLTPSKARTDQTNNLAGRVWRATPTAIMGASRK